MTQICFTYRTCFRCERERKKRERKTATEREREPDVGEERPLSTRVTSTCITAAYRMLNMPQKREKQIKILKKKKVKFRGIF
jgi:hypothetical protein